MNSLQIECYLALAEHGSFSKTAEKMYLAQSTLSKYIMSLENELELTLVDRSRKKISLTPEGELVHDFFKSSREEFSDVVFKAHNLGQEQLRLNIALLEGMDTDRILRPLLDFQFYNSNVSLSFEQLPSYQIPTFLANGKFDMAITMADRLVALNKTSHTIRYEPILNSRLYLYYSIYHPVNDLARNPSFVDFKDDIFLIPAYLAKAVDRDNQQDKLSEMYRQVFGFLPKCRYVESVSAILPNLISGEGVSILSEHCRVNSSVNVKSLPMPVQSDIVYAWCEDRETDLIREILEFNQNHPLGKFVKNLPDFGKKDAE